MSNSIPVTNFDIFTIVDIINNRDIRGCAIKDLRLLSKVVATLRSQLPSLPTEPLEKTEETVKEYNNSIDEIHRKEVVLTVSDAELTYIKARLLAFNSYSPEEEVRDRVISLADKIGI